MVPGTRIENDEVYRRLNKWTTLPAMRKRANGLPDRFYEMDPFFPLEMTKSMPPLLYAASRYSKVVEDNSSVVIWFKQFRDSVRYLTAVFRVRCWKDERGCWPTESEFKSEITDDDSITWHVERRPEVIVSRILKRNVNLGCSVSRDSNDPSTIYFNGILQHDSQEHGMHGRIFNLEEDEDVFF